MILLWGKESCFYFNAVSLWEWANLNASDPFVITLEGSISDQDLLEIPPGDLIQN